LPRFSSCIADINKSQFEYLHDNIDDGKLTDSALGMMPLLKNITKRNLIPVIDFEEFNQKARAKPAITVNYLTVYLASTLRTLGTQSTSSVLFRVP
jgi:hypothetical protein